MKLKQLHAEITTILGADEANGDVEVYLPPQSGDTIVRPVTAINIGRPTALIETCNPTEPGIRTVLSEGAFIQ